MYMVEITDNKFDELVENAEKMLKYGGKVMSCIESIRQSEGRMGERSPMSDYRDMGRDERRRYERGMDYDDEGRYGGRYGERYGGGYYGGGRRY